MLFDKFIWGFAEWFLRTPLLEMTSERNEVIRRIKSKSETINEHLFKWFLMPSSRDRDHWLGEIDDRFYEIENLKWGKKRAFKSGEYFDFIYKEFYTKDLISLDLKRIDRIFSKIELRYKSEFQIQWEINNFVERVGLILKEISYLLENGEYDKSELEKLVNKYLV